MMATFLHVALLLLAISSTMAANALQCASYFQSQNSEHDPHMISCAVKDSQCSLLEDIVANRCGAFPSPQERASCYETQQCYGAPCFRCTGHGKIYAGCKTHWDSSPRWGVGANYPGSPHMECRECRENFCNKNTGARKTAASRIMVPLIATTTVAALLLSSPGM